MYSQEEWRKTIDFLQGQSHRRFALTHPSRQGQQVTENNLTWQEVMCIWEAEASCKDNLFLTWCEPFPEAPEPIPLVLLPRDPALVVSAPAP